MHKSNPSSLKPCCQRAIAAYVKDLEAQMAKARAKAEAEAEVQIAAEMKRLDDRQAKEDAQYKAARKAAIESWHEFEAKRHKPGRRKGSRNRNTAKLHRELSVAMKKALILMGGKKEAALELVSKQIHAGKRWSKRTIRNAYKEHRQGNGRD